jgi:hypothetical protein
MKKNTKEKSAYYDDSGEYQPGYTKSEFIADMLLNGGLQSFEIETLQYFILKLSELHKKQLEEITVSELWKGIEHWKHVFGPKIWRKYS